jgi:hypothetical protein
MDAPFSRHLGPVSDWTRARKVRDRIPARRAIVRPQAEQRSDVLLCLPPAHVQPHFRDHRLSNADVDAVNLSQAYAGDTVQMSAPIKVQLAGARTFPTTSGFRYRAAGWIDFVFHPLQMFVDSLVA